jgi:hypothetical protein
VDEQAESIDERGHASTPLGRAEPTFDHAFPEQARSTMNITGNARGSATGVSSLIAIVTLALSACASTPAPTDQVAVATAAVNQAGSAGATEGAPLEMKSARDKLARANAAMTSKDYDSALALAQQSQVDAQLAQAKTEAAKAQKAADETQEAARVLREEMNRKAK